MTPDITDYLSVTEVAAALNVNVGTVRRWILDGKLRSTKKGGAHLIERAALEQMQTVAHPRGWPRGKARKGGYSE